MCAGLQEEQRQLGVVLLPRHQPIRLNVTFPGLYLLVGKLVRAVLHGQRACGGKQQHSVFDEAHVESTLLAAFQLFIKTLGGLDNVTHTLMPNFSNKSSTESYVVTLPFFTSSLAALKSAGHSPPIRM